MRYLPRFVFLALCALWITWVSFETISGNQHLRHQANLINHMRMELLELMLKDIMPGEHQRLPFDRDDQRLREI